TRHYARASPPAQRHPRQGRSLSSATASEVPSPLPAPRRRGDVTRTNTAHRPPRRSQRTFKLQTKNKRETFHSPFRVHTTPDTSFFCHTGPLPSGTPKLKLPDKRRTP